MAPSSNAAPIATTPTTHPLRLGSIDFPTSGAPDAQPHFLYGIAALHSFWYEEALEAFGRATAIDPDFALAYWGEAMCYHRSYRPGADYNAGRKVLAKIKDVGRLTPRERRYIEAARALFGTRGSAHINDYVAVMEKLRREFPDDLEASAFYALGLLASSGKDNKEMAGKIAEEVYRRNPNHPGAAHYIIHAYDNPEDASRALDAAHHYSKIAPDAPHALHMPSHIFVQLGMWRDAASSNDLGWAASVDYVKRKNLTPTLRDYHNLHWLIYAALQEGKYAKATEFVEAFVRMRSNQELASYSGRYIHSALAAYLIETRRWEQADALFASAGSVETGSTNVRAIVRAGRAREVELCGAAPLPASTAPAATTKSAPSSGADTPVFLRAYAAAASGGVSPVGRDGKLVAGAPAFSKRQQLQLTGLAQAQAGNFPAALSALREAAALEAKTSRPPGPPVEKPAHELLGEVLLRSGNAREAIAQFKIALERHPNRALSLLGQARAEAAAGQTSAAQVTYAKLLEFWKDADATLPELREARGFVAAKVATGD